ncbi:Helix-turn-helix domain-containing protein [Actinacidiphila yanglinensis]|uniref:Helix-turn-helix domain-containing protein n=1 Tax=Actinacidiphila yanglinensis TaxID=310779 RepID=A0A1H5XZT2_9ACTN|nr:helix-turn-helix transcriptional regulator [Actinacidiphila yanglinensis]SEG16870.1 Helix-turn-helix domain-containing protein [Actinacidiphila yanglinensis]
MAENIGTPIGERLREVRKRRGISQRELAQVSGVSLSLIRKLEQGEIKDTRVETARRLAVSLRVPTSRLVARDDHAAESVPQPWAPLQLAVEGPPFQPEDEPTLDGVRDCVAAVRAAYFDGRMADLSAILAPLLRDADALGEGVGAREVRAHLLQIAGSTLTQARQFGAAETALARALDDAPDRHRAASIVTTWSWLLVRQGRLDDSRRLAVRWADDLEPRVSRATSEDLAAWGWLLLQVSSASLRDNRMGEAEDAMRLANSVAVMTGHELPCGEVRLATWGPVTVAYKTAERGIVLDRPDRVLKAAAQLEGVGRRVSTEYHRHRLDVAKAHTMVRQYGEAVTVLSSVRQQAPEWLAQQRYARDILGEVISKRRTLTAEMRELADSVGVPM